ncbi:MAG TPA: Npt1/Npt2 family nucleotide transporter [Terriglobales bacterium]|nr:Npt1/Npt2 family nucleotide transporter [Terriglobales bacterium]
MKQSRTLLERFLGLFADVHAGEGTTAVLLMLNLLVLLTAYLIVKTVREALILSGGGAEVKSYAAAGQALLLLLLVPWYGSIASKVNRIKLINRVTLFFLSHLVIFYLLAQLHVNLGVAFFLWVGVFNLLVIAQFWAFANDLYTTEQGERLFAIVAFGGSLGAILGPAVAGWLFAALGAYRLMLVSAALLAVCIVVTNVINRREIRARPPDPATAVAEAPLGKSGGFGLVMGHRYLLLIALLMVVLNLVNTTGEFVLGKTVAKTAHRAVDTEVQRPTTDNDKNKLTIAQREKAVQNFIGHFYADFFFWVSVASAAAQLFLVSRIFKYVGVSGSLFFLPLISLCSYSLIAFFPILGYIRLAKIAENSTDYSLQNTARQALFLPTSRETKYKAKAAIDTFFVRMGDVLSAGIVFVGTRWLLEANDFARINIGLVAVWLLLVAFIARHYSKLAATCTSFYQQGAERRQAG